MSPLVHRIYAVGSTTPVYGKTVGGQATRMLTCAEPLLGARALQGDACIEQGDWFCQQAARDGAQQAVRRLRQARGHASVQVEADAAAGACAALCFVKAAFSPPIVPAQPITFMRR